MIVSIDEETAGRLVGLVGNRLVAVLGRRYPSPASYDHIQLITEGNRILLIELRVEDVDDKLEVSCICARNGAVVSDSHRFDELRLADFHIDRVLVLRRAEWLEEPAHSVTSVGDAPMEQHIANPGDAPPWVRHALVDAGIALVDDRGCQIVIQADSFPMVMQLQFSVSSAQVARGQARVL